MSYILDALRKADAERERGRIPGIHAQQLASASADADADIEAAGRSKPLLWVIIGLLVALVAALAWNMLGRDGAALTPTAATRLPADAASATPAASAAALQPASAIAATATAAAAAAAAAAASTGSVTTRAAHKRAVRKPAAARTAPATAVTSSDAARPGAKATAPAKEPAPAQRVYALNELPADIRQQLPALVVGGASYSTNPTSRMLILNGQVFHEGDRLTPDLVLQRIKLKAAVLEFKGYRYEIKY